MRPTFIQFEWRGGTYHVYQDTPGFLPEYQYRLMLLREYPEGNRHYYGFGATWLAAIMDALIQVCYDKVLVRRLMK
jgi:hypothetical protein